MKNVVLLIVLFLLSSCRISEDNFHAYYKFSQDDQNKLLNHLTVGKNIVYNNQDGETVSYQVKSVDLSTANIPESPMFADKYLHEEHKAIRMESSDLKTISYKFEKRPVDYNQAYSNVPNTISSFVFATVYFSLFSSSKVVDLNSTKTSLNVNGATYDQVIAVQTGDANSAVDVVYYDVQAGVVGFDDKNGKQWRLVP